MKEIYDWVPWFRELARKIDEGGVKNIYLKRQSRLFGVESLNLNIFYSIEQVTILIHFSFFLFTS